MKKISLLFLLFIISAISCSENILCPTLSLKEGTITSEDEYAIVSAIIESEYQDLGFFHVSQGLPRSRSLESLTTHIENEKYNFVEDAIDLYVSLNEASWIWDSKLYNPNKMINDDELKCHFEVESDGWFGYYKKYEHSNGVFKFARPYIGQNNMAFLEYENNCGYLCGSGFIAILEKEGDSLVVVEIINTWIS